MAISSAISHVEGVSMNAESISAGLAATGILLGFMAFALGVSEASPKVVKTFFYGSFAFFFAFIWFKTLTVGWA